MKEKKASCYFEEETKKQETKPLWRINKGKHNDKYVAGKLEDWDKDILRQVETIELVSADVVIY